MNRRSIGIIGGGVAGIASAYLLQDSYEVTLYDKNNYLGGHTNTIVISEGPDQGAAIDTGFMVCNDRTYPTFHNFLKKLNVKTRYADMWFSVVDDRSGLQYGSADLNMIFAQRSNIINPRFLKFLLGIQRFWNQAKKDVENSKIHEISLGEYLKLHKVSERVVQDFIIPISAAIWSTPDKLMLEFPVGLFLKFYSNHGLLSCINQPRWQTVVGGSFAYVKAFKARFKGQVVLETNVESVSRSNSIPTVHLSDGSSKSYDDIIIATHADEAFKLLRDPTENEISSLSHWRYINNDTILHTDSSFLPSNRRAWASWNYKRELNDDGTSPLSITYHMNRLQGLNLKNQYCVTLNSKRKISTDKVLRQFSYTHPHFTVESMKSQEKIRIHNGELNTWYCGSYMGFGFHEDAVKSGFNVAEALGGVA